MKYIWTIKEKEHEKTKNYNLPLVSFLGAVLATRFIVSTAPLSAAVSVHSFLGAFPLLTFPGVVRRFLLSVRRLIFFFFFFFSLSRCCRRCCRCRCRCRWCCRCCCCGYMLTIFFSLRRLLGRSRACWLRLAGGLVQKLEQNKSGV